MKYFSQKLFIYLAVFLILFVPTIVFATDTGLIPCGHDGTQCHFSDLLQLGRNIVNFLIYLSIPLAAIAFTWSGFLYMTSAGSSSKREEAKKIFVKVFWGFIFVISAWLIVYTITRLLDDTFLLDTVKLK